MLVSSENTESFVSEAGELHNDVSSAEVMPDPDLESQIFWSPTLVDMLRLRAEALPDQVLLTFIGDEGVPDEPVTARELDVAARRVAALLQKLGATNQRVLLALQPGRLYCAAFWGCLYARVHAVPVYPPISPTLAQRVETIAKDCGATLVLTDQLMKSMGAGLGNYAPHLRNLQWQELEDLPEGSEELWNEVDVSPDDLAFLQYTSGTTGEPKGVMISHGNLTANLRSLEQAGRRETKAGEEGSLNKGFSWLPPFHDMGLTGLLLPVATGSELVTCSPMLFIMRPERWVREISKRSGNVSGGPNFAFELLVDRAPHLEGEDIDLSHWRVAVCGAEQVRPETIDRFCETYARYGFQRKAFCPSYGGAEATVYMSSGGHETEPLVCHVDRSAMSRGKIVVRDHADASTCAFVGCGAAGPGLTLLIVDPETQLETGPGKLGEIWAKGPNIGHGYWGKPELTQEAFGGVLNQPSAGLSAGPYFRTGDMGFQHGGELFVAGRMNEIIHVRGRKLFPGDLERTAGQTCDLLTPRGGAAFTLTEGDHTRIVLVHELEERSIHATDLAPALHQALFREHEVQLDELVLIRRNALLKTSSGKPRRLVMREAYSAGKIKILSSWRRS